MTISTGSLKTYRRDHQWRVDRNSKAVEEARPGFLNPGGEIVPPYCHGRGGGPGGWVILDEPEIKLGENIVVPDLAGWKRKRFPVKGEENWIAVAPDWICEVLSQSTARVDRVQKMRIFAGYKVGHAWLIDPVLTTLEVFKLESGRWVLLDAFARNEKVRAEPFHEIEIDLSNLWLEGMT